MDRLRLVGASGACPEPDHALGPAGATSCLTFKSFVRLIAPGLIAAGDAAVLVAAGDAACRNGTCTAESSAAGDNDSAAGKCVASGDGAAFLTTCTGDPPSRDREHHARTTTSGDAHANCADGRHTSPSGTTAGAGPVRSPLRTSPPGTSADCTVGAPGDRDTTSAAEN